MTEISAVCRLIDYKKYFSYGDVQIALSRGELTLPKIEKPVHIKTVSQAKIDYDREYNRKRRKKLSYAGPAIHGKPPKKLWDTIEIILPLWNLGYSDRAIGKTLKFEKSYIQRIRVYFKLPANYGQAPEVPLTIEDIEKRVPRDPRLTKNS